MSLTYFWDIIFAFFAFLTILAQNFKNILSPKCSSCSLCSLRYRKIILFALIQSTMFPPAIYQFLNIQICLHTGPNIDPEQRDVVDIASDKEKLREFISAKFPKVESIPSIEESCIYTLSPDGVHILDKHPRYPNIVVGCGFSGNKFRYSQELL